MISMRGMVETRGDATPGGGQWRVGQQQGTLVTWVSG
jgi:hypothetical protein